MKKIFIYTGIFLVGFVAVSFFSFYLIISPPKIEIERSNANLKLPKKPIDLKTQDGVNLSAWLISSNELKKEKKVIVLLHGYPAEKSDMLGLASKLYPEFNVLLLDLRSFGESEDTYTTLGIKEQKDVDAAVDYLKKEGYEKIGIFGISLGSTAALLSAAGNDKIDAIVLDTSFSDIKSIGYRTYSSLWIVKYPLVEAMGVWGKIVFGKSIRETLYNSARVLDKPILLTHLEKDRFSIEHTLKMKEILTTNKQAEFYFPDWQKEGVPSLEERVERFFKERL